MKGGRIASLVLLTVLSALLLWAGDPWKEKPYTEWTAKDVQKVLADSPWAQPTWMKGQSDLTFSPATGTVLEPNAGTKFVVLWASALTVRQALLRQQESRGEAREGEFAEALFTQPDDYVIVVRWEGMEYHKAFDVTNAELKLGRSKRKVGTTKMEFEGEGSRITGVVLSFPRETAESTLAATETKIAFSCVVRGSSPLGSPYQAILNAEFDLRKMVRDGKPDL